MEILRGQIPLSLIGDLSAITILQNQISSFSESLSCLLSEMTHEGVHWRSVAHLRVLLGQRHRLDYSQ